MSDVVIKTEGLTRCFGANAALSDVNLEIQRGSMVALLGPNGAGKTTFLRLLMGLLEPTAGQIRVLGRPTRPMPDAVARCVGYVADTADPPRWITVNQLIDLKAAVVEHVDAEMIRGMLHQRGIGLFSVYGSLSKGQKKWVRTAISLAARPELLLMDEPAEGLDPSARRELYDRLRDLVNECKTTAVITTHVIGDIERVADEVTVLRQGQVKLTGWLEDLREQVREVQMPQGDDDLKLPEDMQLLKKQTHGHEQILWLRSPTANWDAIQQKQARMHPVSLETLYLTLTEET